MYSFPKAEKLCSKKIIEDIYANGTKLKSFPFILSYKFYPKDVEFSFPVQILFSVPKRKVKKAVQRNRLKRQIREAYRLHKSQIIQITQEKNVNLALFLTYIGKEKAEYQFIEKKIVLLLKLLEEKYESI